MPLLLYHNQSSTQSRYKVVLPAPFGPAMIMTFLSGIQICPYLLSRAGYGDTSDSGRWVCRDASFRCSRPAMQAEDIVAAVTYGL